MTPTVERHFGAGGGIEPHGFYAVFLNYIFLSCRLLATPTRNQLHL